MSQDMNSICSNGCRIAKCMKEYFLYKKSYRGALNSTLLAKCLHQKLWDDSQYLLKQLPGIGMVTAKALLSMGVKSFETLSDADPRKIELITGRKYPYGNHIKESLLSLPPKVEMIVKETDGQKLGKSKLLITLTRLSQPVQSTKRHYADMMVGIEEENLVLFYEKVRLEEFSSPYSAVVLYPRAQQGKLTIKANLIVEEFIGIDLHQKVIITPEIDFSINHKYRLKEPSFSKPKGASIVKDDNDSAPHAPAAAPNDSIELIEKSNSMPSFKLLDEELEEDNTVVESEDDDCKIITERTVFDHIREKAKTLPALPVSIDDYSPSLETFALIRKRTREMHLELDNDIEVLDVRGSNKCPPNMVSIRYPEPTELEQNRYIFEKDGTPDITNGSNGSYLMNTGQAPIKIWSGEGNCVTDSSNIEPRSLNQEKIFERIRKKSGNFPIFDKWRIADTKIHTMDHDSSQNIVSKNGSSFDVVQDIMILDSEALPTRRSPHLKEKVQKLKDILHCETKTVGLPSNVGLELKTNPSIEEKNDGEYNVKHLQSPTLMNKQSCLLGLTGEIEKEKSFLGFQSVFSFL